MANELPRAKEPIAAKFPGLVQLSYIFFKKTFTPKIPILALHGIHDDIIKIEYAKESYKKFLSEDNFSFLTFYKGHEVIFEEIEHIKKFLMRI